MNPSNPTKSGVTLCAAWVNFPRHQGDDGPSPAGNATQRPQLPNVGVTIGVAAGSANPRAEFNVIVGGAYHLGGEPLRMRISGNFIGFMPDGVTPFDMSTENATTATVFGYIGSTVEFGRYGEVYASSPTQGQPVVIGTDGDGVNDADEGNLWGPIGGVPGTAGSAGKSPALIHYYRSGNNTFLISGNRWAMGNDGKRWPNSAFFMAGLYSYNQADGNTRLIIGSDFASSRSAATIAAQANQFYNNLPLSLFGDPPSSPSGYVPFLGYEHPNPTSSETTGPDSWVSLRGNVMVGNGLAPYTYAELSGGALLPGLANFFIPYLDTSDPSVIVPVLTAGGIYPNLSGTFAKGIAPFTNIIVDVYQLDPEGWTNGQAWALPDLMNPLTSTYNGFPQGKKYIGSYPIANTGSFSIALPAVADFGNGQVTVAVNYSADPVGTAMARTETSEFAMPVYVLPAGSESVGLTHTVPDMACWYDSVRNTVTNGPIVLPNQPNPCQLGNWEPWVSVMGDTTFLVEFNTYANDGLYTHQNNVVALQPANGGAAKLNYAYYGDNGTPVKGVINFRRQNGNPGKVAGDMRHGGTKYMTECEVSVGQLAPFQTVNPARWSNNNIYQGTDLYPENGNQGTAGNAYAAEQLFSLDPTTLAVTPVAPAWDYVYGPFVGAMGTGNNAPQVSRTGGRPNFLDNGNIVVMIDDKTCISSTSGEVTTFSIIQPDGTVIKGPTLAKAQDIFDNMCGVKGGFVIRVHNSLLFYNNSGTLTYSNDCNVSSGMNFGGSADAGGRGDGIRIGGNIYSYYVYMAGTAGGGGGSSAPMGVAVWDTRTGQFVGGTYATDGDPTTQISDRAMIAVDEFDRFCVTWAYKPTADFGYQAVARVGKFDGSQFTWLTHSFYPFLNHDQNPTGVQGYTTINPYVAMTASKICIAAKGTINANNNVAAGPDSQAQQTVYTVIPHPVPVVVTQPTITISQPDKTHIKLSWDISAGAYTVQGRSTVNSGTWVNLTNSLPPVTLPIGATPEFMRLAN